MTKRKPQNNLVDMYKVRLEKSPSRDIAFAITLPDGYDYNNIRLHMTRDEYEQFKKIINDGLISHDK